MHNAHTYKQIFPLRSPTPMLLADTLLQIKFNQSRSRYVGRVDDVENGNRKNT